MFKDKNFLPTAPRASRILDEHTIPNNPPYTAFIANLSYDVEERNIFKFFRMFRVRLAHMGLTF